ncbi:MAG: hypothetical protein J6Z79_06695 [Clostridia bacterium]|nr:hypothetical protein [Clostridia bacterium]
MQKDKMNPVSLLREKAEMLGRLPKKEDFPPEDVARIKGILGPWPRALEAAGLKEARKKTSLDKNREKRKRKARLKRRANAKKRREEG